MDSVILYRSTEGKYTIWCDIPAWLFQDEHGQSILHFAAARSHGRNALFQMLQEADINIGYRDELYRTARDVAIQAHIPENIQDIDKWVLYMAARGKRKKMEGPSSTVSLSALVTNCFSCFVLSMKLGFTLWVMNRWPNLPVYNSQPRISETCSFSVIAE